MGFKAQARATNFLCLWAAKEMGKTGDEVVAYAKERLREWLKPGAGDIVAKIAAEIAAARPTVTESAVRAKYGEFMRQAQKQILDEG
jgi:hypothetical protein